MTIVAPIAALAMATCTPTPDMTYGLLTAQVHRNQTYERTIEIGRVVPPGAWIATATATVTPTPNAEATCVAVGHLWSIPVDVPMVCGPPKGWDRVLIDGVWHERCRRCGLWRERP